MQNPILTENIRKLADSSGIDLLGFAEASEFEGYLLNQCLERGEILAFYDGICLMLKKLLTILAAINKVYFSANEPRWIEQELEEMAIHPPDMWKRIKELFDGDRRKALEILEDLTNEVLEIVGNHMPDIDVNRLRHRRKEMYVGSCETKPEIKK